MSPSEKVRAMLDERGIEWCSGLEGVTFVGDWCFVEYDGGKIAATCEPVLTPEQAIAATVGAGTCHMEVHDNLDETEGMGDVWLECDKCHWQMMLEPTTPRFKYCPNCRAEIKED